MASKKQLEANKANAKRSTGPKSQLGKARSRRNSWKHGLTAETLIIGGEEEARFKELRSELMQQHDPQSALEAELVERLVGILWRLRRVPFFEAAILDARQDNMRGSGYNSKSEDEEGAEMSDAEWRIHVGHALIHDSSGGDALGKLARHEATLINAFTKKSHQPRPGARTRIKGRRDGCHEAGACHLRQPLRARPLRSRASWRHQTSRHKGGACPRPVDPARATRNRPSDLREAQ